MKPPNIGIVIDIAGQRLQLLISILSSNFRYRTALFRTIRMFSEPAGIKYWIVRKASVRTERTKIRVFLILTNIGVTSAHLALPLGSPVHIWMAS